MKKNADSRTPAREIYLLKRKDVSSAARVLARAFHDSPMMQYIIPDEGVRERRLHHLFRVFIGLAMRKGVAVATSSDLEGVACWYPPGGRKDSLLDYILSGGLTFALLTRSGVLDRLDALGETLEPLRERYAATDHYYLSPIGVDPAHQGKGLGSRLLTLLVDEAKRENVQVYLETAQERNVRFYEHHGFEVKETAFLPRTRMPVWAMALEP